VDALTSAPGEHARGISFTGRWQDYLKIAVTNLLLTIVTLGIYRFWATARQRRYLWSNTRIIDDELEWTGTGGEMFIGFLMVMGIFLGWGALIMGGAALLGQWFIVLGAVCFYIFLLWGFGFAQFRALRYRLSRTYWRGIRGGSDDNGVGYGWSALGYNFVAGLTAGIMVPYAITQNWNDRIRAMSFGPYMLDSDVNTKGLQWRWMMLYVVYIGFAILAAVIVAIAAPDPAVVQQNASAADPTAVVFIQLAPLVLLVGIGLVMVSFWAAFFRKAAGTFALGELTAAFEVSTVDWLKFYAKLVGLTIITLGFGLLMWGYWRWEFVMNRLELFGEIDVAAMTQSTTTAPKDAEGFADAFDIGAF
jgi:uncharacterized membrane protein YjgN (DUF898 family)